MENENYTNNHDGNTGLDTGDPSGNNAQKPKLSPVTAAVTGLVAVFLLYEVFGSLMTLAILGLDIRNADVTSLRLLTMAGQILFILLPALVFANYVYSDVTRLLRVRMPEMQELFFFIIGLVVLTFLLQSYIMIQSFIVERLAVHYEFVRDAKSFLDQLDKTIESSYKSLLTADNLASMLLVVLVVSVVPAVSEEAFFRGYIQGSLEHKYSPFASSLFTAIIFGAFHFHPYQIVPLAALGMYFGYAAYKSNSIVIPVVLHFLNNFSAVILFFAVGNDDLAEAGGGTFGDIQLVAVMFMGLLVMFFLLVIFMNRYYYRKEELY